MYTKSKKSLNISQPFRLKKGFTLVELMVVITIIVILASVVAPAFNTLSKTSDVPNNTQQLQSLLDLTRLEAKSKSLWHFIAVQSKKDGELRVRVYAAEESINQSSIEGTRARRDLVLTGLSLSKSTENIERPTDNTSRLGNEGGWLIVSPQGTVHIVDQAPDLGNQDNVAEMPKIPKSLPKFIEIEVTPRGGKDTNGAVLQILGITGQSKVYLPS